VSQAVRTRNVAAAGDELNLSAHDLLWGQSNASESSPEALVPCESHPRVFAAAKAADISFFALFFADAGSVSETGKTRISTRLFCCCRSSCTRAYLAETFLLFHLRSWRMIGVARNPVSACCQADLGEQSVGVVGIRDENTCGVFFGKETDATLPSRSYRIPRDWRVLYTQPGRTVGFLCVAAKQPVVLERSGGADSTRFRNIFHHQDITHNVDRERLLELCRTIAATLRTNTFVLMLLFAVKARISNWTRCKSSTLTPEYCR